MRLALLLAALAATIALGLAELMSRGEVITLITEDRYGVHRDTALWVVERGDVLYLRAGRPDAAWVRRGRLHPLVEVRRSGIREPYVFVPVYDDRVRAFVNEAMARKYGFADRVFTLLADPARVLPIRLEPRERRGPLEAPPAPEIRSPLIDEPPRSPSRREDPGPPGGAAGAATGPGVGPAASAPGGTGAAAAERPEGAGPERSGRRSPGAETAPSGGAPRAGSGPPPRRP